MWVFFQHEAGQPIHRQHFLHQFAPVAAAAPVADNARPLESTFFIGFPFLASQSLQQSPPRVSTRTCNLPLRTRTHSTPAVDDGDKPPALGAAGASGTPPDLLPALLSELLVLLDELLELLEALGSPGGTMRFAFCASVNFLTRSARSWAAQRPRSPCHCFLFTAKKGMDPVALGHRAKTCSAKDKSSTSIPAPS